MKMSIELEPMRKFCMMFTSNQQCEMMGIVIPREPLFYFELYQTEYGLHYYQVLVSEYVEGYVKWLTEGRGFK